MDWPMLPGTMTWEDFELRRKQICDWLLMAAIDALWRNDSALCIWQSLSSTTLLKLECACKLTRILLNCRFWFSRSGVRPEFCISNILPGEADVSGPSTILWVASVYWNLPNQLPHSQISYSHGWVTLSKSSYWRMKISGCILKGQFSIWFLRLPKLKAVAHPAQTFNRGLPLIGWD